MFVRYQSVFTSLLFASVMVADDYRVVSTEFVFDDLPHESCHASTIAHSKTGLVCAWFGGVREGHKSVGIWLSRRINGRWNRPVELANGNQKDGTRFPCWNPVLFQMPDGDLYLFYKVGPSPREWWGRMTKSADGGKSWSESKRLPDGFLGPVKNKPLLMSDGSLLCGSSTEHDGWKVHLEWARQPWDLSSWTKSESLKNMGSKGAIQPTLLRSDEGYQMLCRNQQRETILTSRSKDGKKWEPLKASELPNPNSGIDAVTLKDGSHLLVYNPIRSGRSPISIALKTKGKSWKKIMDLETEPRQEFSYPAVIETADGLVHVTYTWKRKKIKHLVLSR